LTTASSETGGGERAGPAVCRTATMIDSHVHLDHAAFSGDLDQVLARAVEDGVSAVVNVGYDRESARATAAFVDRYPFFFGIVGTHPHDASKHDADYESELKDLLDRPRILGVGEVGLDYYYDHSPREVQRNVFRRMLRLSRLKDKPVVIHCRDAAEDALEILSSERIQFRGIFHAFNGDAAMALRVTELGFHLGIGGVATYKNSKLVEILRAIPLERIVLETDSPYLAPHPFRGRRNEPSLLSFVVKVLSDVHGVAPAEIVRRTTDNFCSAIHLERGALPSPVYKIGKKVYIHTPPASDQGGRLAGLAIEAAESGPTEEAVLCGLDEPLENLEQVLACARSLKPKGVPVRLLTRGAGGMERDVFRELSGLVDVMTVRMGGCTAAQDEKVRGKVAGEGTFDTLVDFVRRSIAAGIATECLFVAVPKMKLEPCEALAKQLGAAYSVRNYRPLE
jgi:TatD DNase family protein